MAFVCGVLLMWPFVFDTAFTLVRRLQRREAVFKAHRSHLYQRLTSTGSSHRFVTSIYAGLAMFGLLAAVGTASGGKVMALAGVATIAAAALWLWRFVVGREAQARPNARRSS